MDEATIRNRFTYHAPVADQAARYAKINEAALNLALVINDNCPESADKTDAIRKTWEARMTANGAIACNE